MSLSVTAASAFSLREPPTGASADDPLAGAKRRRAMSPGREPASASDARPNYRFMLFVAGEERNSRLARENLVRLCESDLQGRCDVEIVDVLEDFETAAKHQVLLTPCLLWIDPPPGAMIIGNLMDLERVRSALHLDQS
jgi:circadian clock protein KaiB